MPNVLKRLYRAATADDYVFRPAEELIVKTKAPPVQKAAPESAAEKPPGEEAPIAEELTPEEQELSYARVQADAILRDAEQEAEAYKAQAMEAFQEELETLRQAAQQEGYSQGYAEGMAAAAAEGQAQIDALTRSQIQEVERFLETAARERDRLLDSTREEMKDLALAIAEKVIRVSLRNSSDILLRMVDAATDTHKKCEWAHIYVADCDLSGKAYTASELTAALGHVSNRIRVIPMADDESGTCIVELPDVILDASVSTQLGNIKEVLSGATLDKE